MVLALSYQRFLLSRVSYTLIFLFLSLHAVGAHYTYAQVPYDAWLHNHVHFHDFRTVRMGRGGIFRR